MSDTIDLTRLEAFAEHVLTDQGAIFGGVLTYLGDRLGLYRAMAGHDALTSAELASAAGCAERNVREWLAAQAAAGYVEYDATTDTYHLPDEHAAVLADDGSPAAMIGGVHAAASAWADADRILDAFRSGDGLGWHERDHRLFCGTERFYAPGYRTHLVDTWLTALDGVVTKLERGANVLDVGSGHGVPLLLMAQAFPASTFVGIDYHASSVATASARAAELGVADRVRFEVASATGYRSPTDGWDLICFFDVLHDLGDPVGAAAHARDQLAEDGTLLLVEPRAGDDVADNLHPVGRLFYAASTLLCTPIAQSQPGPDGDPSPALGAQAGPVLLRAVLADGGFTRVREAAASPVNSIIEARP
jgi:SAM-dependent methyltransferase